MLFIHGKYTYGTPQMKQVSLESVASAQDISGGMIFLAGYEPVKHGEESVMRSSMD